MHVSMYVHTYTYVYIHTCIYFLTRNRTAISIEKVDNPVVYLFAAVGTVFSNHLSTLIDLTTMMCWDSI